VATAEDVRRVASALPRTEEKLIRDRVKFKVGRLVYAAISPDETRMGFAFPKQEREALVGSNPAVFRMPVDSDLRYNWVRCWLEPLDPGEMRELIIEAWSMCVPKSVAAEYFRSVGL
jgi:hypothetical protein